MKTTFNSKLIARSMVLLAVMPILMLMNSFGSSNASYNTCINETDLISINAPGNTTTEAILKARKNGNAVFLIITDSAKADFDKAKTIADEAHASVKKSVVVTLDRDDKNNADLVANYNLAVAPLPLFIVISPKGVLVNGFLLANATVDLLINSIPTPKQDEVLAAINDKKSVFIVAAKSLFADKAKAIAACDSAIKLNNSKSVLVEINLSDTKESAFLGTLKINTATTTSAIVVVNSKGQITGTFYDTQKAATLALQSNKVITSCCAPGVKSSSKSCAPKK